MIHDDSSDYPAVKMGMPFSGFALRTKGRRPQIVPELKRSQEGICPPARSECRAVVRRSFNGPTKRHINGPAIDGGSSCPKGVFHDSEEKSILSQALLKRRSFYEVEPGPNKTNSRVPGAGNIHQKDGHSLPGWPQHSEEIPKKFAS